MRFGKVVFPSTICIQVSSQINLEVVTPPTYLARQDSKNMWESEIWADINWSSVKIQSQKWSGMYHKLTYAKLNGID